MVSCAAYVGVVDFVALIAVLAGGQTIRDPRSFWNRVAACDISVALLSLLSTYRTYEHAR